MSNEIIKVYSHPRSGTNFLCSILKKNFYPDIDLSKGGGWGHWSSPQIFDEPVAYGQLFGSHKLPNYIKKQYKSIYIYRDGRDVAFSIWRSNHFLNEEMSILSFSKFLRTDIDWKGSPSIKTKPHQNIISHWVEHVDKWRTYALANEKNVLLIRYEDLVLDPYKQIDKISKGFGLKLSSILKTEAELVGPSPNDGKICKWKQCYSKVNLNYFLNQTKKKQSLLYRGDC